MKTKYFTQCETIEELKKLYHKLAIKFHPDNGGNAEIMKEINAEFDYMHSILKNVHKKADGTKWQAEKGSKAENTEKPEEYREMIDELIKYNVIIEFIGCYIWVSGDTKPIKERLKEYGFKWSSSKSNWYLKPENYIPRSKKSWTMDEIRFYHGVQKRYEGHKQEGKQEEYEKISG